MTTATHAVRTPEPPATPGPGRVYNFSAGPACMPESVLAQLRDELLDFGGTGIGLLEQSHRGAAYDRILAEAFASVRACAGIGDDWEVLFLPGGSMQHFPLIAMNFVPKDGWVAFADTGLWTHKGEKEVACVRRTRKVFDGASCRFDHVPSDAEIGDCSGAAYFCYCSNNTVEGTQFARPPRVAAPLVCDATSDIFSRPWGLAAHDLIFSSGQKNLGASGISLVLVRKSFLERADRSLPPMLSYAHFAKTESRPNTPPTFGVRTIGLMAKWTFDHGGPEAFGPRNRAKAAHVYGAIDRSGGFYRPSMRSDCRSDMSISFWLPSDALLDRFVAESEREGLCGLRGHRDWGGVRACVYNAFPSKGCELLAQFMDEFARKNG
ncbi:MAG: 3-phosphoserine/phosphohydroxythreonine transaminase [Planctomycetes bacterium]|nr:3-phosphoserine/phosphohydroxythreonine transaminase [Planctomycetota bacterium]